MEPYEYCFWDGTLISNCDFTVSRIKWQSTFIIFDKVPTAATTELLCDKNGGHRSQWFHISKNKWKWKYKREKKILCAVFEIIPFIHSKNNIWILFWEHLGGRKEEWNLRIALINFLVMRFILNFDTSFYFRVLLKSKRREL